MTLFPPLNDPVSYPIFSHFLKLFFLFLKVFKTPEVARVYIGTFWDHPLHYDINRRLFQDEQHDLFADLQVWNFSNFSVIFF